ncbi:hypothetical protein KR009_007503 [Drosophila setifemur]|nr:hypothetical protein KR009_007503 [Drosophila setifemur]
MYGSATGLFVALLAWNFYGFLGQTPESSIYVNLLPDEANQCSEFCRQALHPVLANFSVEQQLEWSEIQGKFDRMENQLAKMREILHAVLSSFVLHEGKLRDDFEVKLENTKEQLTDLQESLLLVTKMGMNPRFERIGSRYFYIENELEVNWKMAVQTCRLMGGYLATIKDEEEMFAINQTINLLENRTYWLGINDLATRGNFVSVASGKPAFLRWHRNYPEYLGKMHCVGLHNSAMVDSRCLYHKNFICQADDEF